MTDTGSLRPVEGIMLKLEIKFIGLKVAAQGVGATWAAVIVMIVTLLVTRF